MTEDTRYNGWTNYETWCVGLWIDNEEGSYRYWQEEATRHHKTGPDCGQVEQGIWTPTEAAKFNLADQLKAEIEEATPLTEASMYSDLLNAALSEVNWQEIAGNMLDALPEQEPAQPEPSPVVYAYTRAQAIEDGVLVDVTQTAQEAGLKYPTALTRSVWEQYVSVPPAVPWQDEQGRLWDVLWMLLNSIRRGSDGSQVDFTVMIQNDALPARAVRLKALCGPGDSAEPVITVMLPNED